MQNMQKIYEDIFGEIRNTLEDLSKSESYKTLLSKENEINTLYQKFSFLKISQEPAISSANNIASESIVNQGINSNSDIEKNFEEENKIEEIIVEAEELHDIFEDVPEVEEVRSFVEIDESENPDLTDESISENILDDNSQKLEPMKDSQFSFAMEKEEMPESSNEDYEARLCEKENKLRELEEKRRKIVEFSRESSVQKEKPQTVVETSHHEQHDKKFKLANIKGLKAAKTLFDDDPLENEENSPISSNTGSLLKNNVPTDYMEAQKPKPEFKLDLNDRIAFSQYLFGGSQSELNEVVAKLNSYNDLEKAKEYLSELYYKNHWEKADTYAQRLWTLVENRFL